MKKLCLTAFVCLGFIASLSHAADPPQIVISSNGQVEIRGKGGERSLVPCEGIVTGSLEEWLVRVEVASKRSQDVFAPLSKQQMMHQPANGTHTPAWNAEHMLGRHLLFFSQIYHVLNSEVPVMDRNPAQMPKDFEAAHPNWDGKRYAEEMAKVAAFCRYYAPLLRDIELDTKPPATRWPSMTALLKQMERHYDEHTANVKEKFELPDWPQK